ncbi:MAG TPA: TVP38/TMEM64 family protein, partial [Syntrophales bacterium]|nr:TVP38/TMEM64 family protein [Syntrophales bacterium]
GGVGCLNPELSGAWGKKIQEEAQGQKLLTYCAGCVNHLKGLTPTSHIIDFVLDPEATLAGKEKIAKAPLTYLNRLKLKSRFKKTLDAAVTRERTFNAEAAPKGGLLKKVLLLGILVAAIFLVRYTGATQYLEQEKMRALIQGYGALAPVIYMLIYTLAPALLLPGLPLTIAGGILFGPFWGVVYTITSATAGACVAFLAARYIARDWMAGKLQSPRWRRLDEEVERQEWKVVAFTRLIPAFPFNLLNYAFGLTKIKFSHYAITTFICMLPACIAFIVFSSSLLDLIRGKVSPSLIIGLGLIVLVFLIPSFYKKTKTRQRP